MTFLLISFSGILKHVQSGMLNLENMSTALFYFGCTRDHAMNPWNPDIDGKVYNELDWISEDDTEQRRVHGILKEALSKAEEEGRARFRKIGEPTNYESLNELLTANGYDQLKFEPCGTYNYPTVEEKARKQGSHIQVIWQ
jgi:hypothetical protein